MGLPLVEPSPPAILTGEAPGVNEVEFGRGSTSCRLGWQGAFEAAYEAQVKNHSMLGLQVAFGEKILEQNDRIRQAGLEPPEEVFPYRFWRYTDAARYYEGETEKPLNEDTLNRIRQYDQRIHELRSASGKPVSTMGTSLPGFTNLMTVQETWKQTKSDMELAEQRWEQAITEGLAAKTGGFLGGMAGALNPVTDPFNVATLPVGGLSGGFVRRVASQAGVQGAVEGVDQLAGVQENRRLAGLPHGWEQGLTDVAGAALFGAAFQAGGEVLTAGARRAFTGKWFASTPDDPAPSPPDIPDPLVSTTGLPRFDAEQLDLPFDIPKVYGPSRLANLRTAQDLAAVEQQLQDFNGPSPIDVRPHSNAPADFHGGPLSEEELARVIDPEAFRQWDKMTAEATRLRGSLRQADISRAEAPQLAPEAVAQAQAAKTIEDQISTLETRAAGLKNRKQLAAIRGELDELRQQRQTLLPQVAMPGVPGTYRSQLMRVDEKLRDLGPLLARARAAAHDEWPAISARQGAGLGAAPEPVQLRMNSLLKRMQKAPDRAATLPPRELPIEHHFPQLNQNQELLAKLPANADAVDKMVAIRGEEVKAEDAALVKFRARLGEMLKPLEDLQAAEMAGETIVTINGRTVDLKNDIIADPSGRLDEHGKPATMSIRQFLKAAREDGDVLSALETCSVRF